MSRRSLHSAVTLAFAFCAIVPFYCWSAPVLQSGMRSVPSCPIQRRAECEVVRCSPPVQPIAIVPQWAVEPAVFAIEQLAGFDQVFRRDVPIDFWHSSTSTIVLRI